MLFELLFEGFDAALAPCSFILLVPGLACLLTARQEATSAASGFFAAAVVAAWLFFSARVDRPPAGLLALAVGAALVALAIPLIRRVDLVSLAGGALAGAACAFLWEPCVGEQFGTLLGELPARGLSGLGYLLVYAIGVLAPLILVAAALHLVPDGALFPIRPAMLFLGGGVLGLLALTIAVGLDDELVSWLVARTAVS